MTENTSEWYDWNIVNVHSRELECTKEEAWELIEQLGSTNDILWPNDSWPRFERDGEMKIGTKCGHGPIRYVVESYSPNENVRFRFSNPKGFDGFHEFSITQSENNLITLRHILKMTPKGSAKMSWPLCFRWLHDALIEDALDNAIFHFDGTSNPSRQWPIHVNILRKLSGLFV